MSEKYSFKNDYSEGAHPYILESLLKSNMEQLEGYGEDKYSILAQTAISEKLGIKDCDIHFLSGGTQTNRIFIAAALKSFESAISADSGHINVHEAGAIEATGHKINVAMSKDGKILPNGIEEIVHTHTDEHMVKPKLVYISNSTENGTIYSFEEIKAIYQCCKKNNLLLYMDGARLAQALSSPFCDYNLSDIHNFFDGYYIGGTKNGCFLGEALVINNDNIKENFRYCIKQIGGLLAKGRILGIQFYELFKGNLFFDLGKIAVDNALYLANKLADIGIKFRYQPQTNQIFPIFSNKLIEYLHQFFEFYVWEEIDSYHSTVRIVTSWATKREDIEGFYNKIMEFLK